MQAVLQFSGARWLPGLAVTSSQQVEQPTRSVALCVDCSMLLLPLPLLPGCCSGLRLLSLVNDILDATALDRKRLTLNRSRVPLRPLLEEVADITQPLVRRSTAQHSS